MEQYIKTKFKVIRAAGGVVDKEGKTLLIHRNGLWDLPKGKMERNEDIRSCALREVEEETGVKVAVQKKFAIRGTRIQKRKNISLKKHTGIKWNAWMTYE